MVSFRTNGGTIDYPHIIEFNKAFIAPFTSGDRLDVTKLLKFSTNFVVIDRLTGSRISQRYDQCALRISGWYKTQDNMRGGHST